MFDIMDRTFRIRAIRRVEFYMSKTTSSLAARNFLISFIRRLLLGINVYKLQVFGHVSLVV